MTVLLNGYVGLRFTREGLQWKSFLATPIAIGGAKKIEMQSPTQLVLTLGNDKLGRAQIKLK